MTKPLYYGEIVSKITDRLFDNPDHKARIDYIMSENGDANYTKWTLCADAGRVFDDTEDRLGDFFIDWRKALDNYILQLLDYLLTGQIPNCLDMNSMVARSIEHVR